MQRLGDLLAWLGSQPPLFLLITGVALYSSAVGLALLLQSVCEDRRKPASSASRRAAARTLLAQAAKTLGSWRRGVDRVPPAR